MSRIVEKYEPGMIYSPICNMCIHRKKHFTCDAYPGGIPKEITSGKVDHHKPYKGDHGIQFEPIEE